MNCDKEHRRSKDKTDEKGQPERSQSLYPYIDISTFFPYLPPHLCYARRWGKNITRTTTNNKGAWFSTS